MSYGYNGFGKAIQDSSTRFMFAAIKKGIIAEYPESCDCCGQTEGKIGYHAESYAVPFGPHIVAFDVCHLCHVMIHADRSEHGRRLREYVASLKLGHRFRNFKSFNWKGAKAKYLNSATLPAPIDPELYGENTSHDRDLLDDILREKYNPLQHSELSLYAPPHKVAMFDGHVSTQPGFTI